MPETLLRLLHSVLVVALLGLGPATRLADALLYHSSAIPASAGHQADDGSVPRPHGDGCLLAVVSAPATPAMACADPIALAPAVDLPAAPLTRRAVALRATGPPATRAPPA
jgi:hypothetical protein